MDKIQEKFNKIRSFCESNANPAVAKKYARFFTEGYDAYGLTLEIYENQRDKWLEDWKDQMSMEDYFELGNMLIETGKYEEASFAIAFLYLNTEKLSPQMFERVGKWLENGIVNWGHTDVLSGKVLAYFINNQIVEINTLKSWSVSQSIWKRRSVPVTLVEALKTGIPLQNILDAVEPLMEDDAHKVQQGLGWLLREAWKKFPGPVEKFLLKWKDTCGRTIIQYATEKMGKEDKVKFKKSKKA